MDRILATFQSLSAWLVAAPFGSGEFYTLVVIAAAVLLVLGKVIASSVGGSRRGMLSVFIGHVLIIAAALLGAVLVLAFLQDSTSSSGALRVATIGAAVVLGLIVLVLVSKPLLGTSVGAGIATALFALAIAYATLWVGDKVFALLDEAEDKVEEIQEKLAE